MGLGGGAEISQYRVRFSRDLLMMNVMFETSVLSVNWRGSAVGMHSDGLVGESCAADGGEAVKRMACHRKVLGSNPSCGSWDDNQPVE